MQCYQSKTDIFVRKTCYSLSENFLLKLSVFIMQENSWTSSLRIYDNTETVMKSIFFTWFHHTTCLKFLSRLSHASSIMSIVPLTDFTAAFFLEALFNSTTLQNASGISCFVNEKKGCFSLELVSLTDEGADPNHVGANNRIPPVVWAAHHGYHRVLKVRQICAKSSIIAFTAFAIKLCTHKKFLPPIGTFCNKNLSQTRKKRHKKRKNVLTQNFICIRSGGGSILSTSLYPNANILYLRSCSYIFTFFYRFSKGNLQRRALQWTFPPRTTMSEEKMSFTKFSR